MNLVTNWWAERCLFGKCLVDPADYALSKPFDHASITGMFLELRKRLFFGNADVVGFSGLTIHSTGFVGIELLHVTKVVTLMGTGTSPRMPIQADSSDRRDI